MASDGGPDYTVDMSTVILERLERLRDVAFRHRVPKGFAEDLRAVIERLKTDPVAWGDPLYDWHQLGMTVQRGQSPFLYVYYCVTRSRRLVFIQHIEPYQYGPLA
jgi:hypothetical protein